MRWYLIVVALVVLYLAGTWYEDKFDPGKFMMTSWHGNAVALLALCEGNPTVAGEFPIQLASNAEILLFW